MDLVWTESWQSNAYCSNISLMSALMTYLCDWKPIRMWIMAALFLGLAFDKL